MSILVVAAVGAVARTMPPVHYPVKWFHLTG